MENTSQIISHEEKKFIDRIKSIIGTKVEKNATAVSKTLDLFEAGHISKNEALLLIESMTEINVNVGGITVNQDGYNCNFGNGHAGHIEYSGEQYKELGQNILSRIR